MSNESALSRSRWDRGRHQAKLVLTVVFSVYNTVLFMLAMVGMGFIVVMTLIWYFDDPSTTPVTPVGPMKPHLAPLTSPPFHPPTSLPPSTG